MSRWSIDLQSYDVQFTVVVDLLNNDRETINKKKQAYSL